MAADTGTLTFGDYTLDLVGGQLCRGTTPVAMTPKSFAVLHYLASRPGHLIPKKELLDAIWPGVQKKRACAFTFPLVGRERTAFAVQASAPRTE